MEAMTSNERLLSALRGESVDRIPWSPFLAYWWEHQPQDFQARGQVSFFREIGADALLRGFVTAFDSSDVHGLSAYPGFILPIPGVEFSRKGIGDDWFIKYETPVGALHTVARNSPIGNTRFVVEHPVKTREDYKILSWIISRMQIEPNYSAVQQEIDLVGHDGLSMPLISPFLKTPFQSLIEHFVGTERLIYDLADYPEEVEALLEIMSEKARRAVLLSAESPAQAFITWEDSSTTNVSPTLFARYIAPEISAWGEIIHDAGKFLVHHACGHLKALLPIMAEECVDAIESVSSQPTGNVTMAEAREVLGPEMGLIGGIEPVHFLNLSVSELREYVVELLDQMPVYKYILANSDSCPPGVQIEKFRMITDLVRTRKI
jgi:uroporphyrinogen-III decarboxylase